MTQYKHIDVVPAPRRGGGPWLPAAALIFIVVATGGALAAWKIDSIRDQAAAAANQPEPMETVTLARAATREHRPTVTSIGTVLATRSITLRNELSGTVREVSLIPGQIVAAGTLLVQLDVSVEEAELQAEQAQAALAQTMLERNQQASQNRAVSEIEVDRAQAELDVARAQIARTKAVIAKKTIRAPFRARVGMSDIHPGQYLEGGSTLTTLQGIDDSANVDFAVSQRVAAGLREGSAVNVFVSGSPTPVAGTIVAVDARIDPTTRNALVRARIKDPGGPAPGASVRVEVPDGPARTAVAVPVGALRKGPAGDHVFVIAPGERGELRAHVRPVLAGPLLGDEVLILDGLLSGERVAATGSFKLREGALVGDPDEAKPAVPEKS